MVMHRGYHVLAIPTWERKIRVLAVWLTALMFGRDIASLETVQHRVRRLSAEGNPMSLTMIGLWPFGPHPKECRPITTKQ